MSHDTQPDEVTLAYREAAEEERAYARERRIRELVREWLGRPLYTPDRQMLTVNADEMGSMVTDAARLIDALDSATVPGKGEG